MNDAWLSLALETSSTHGSVALGRGEAVLAWRVLSADRRHTAEVLPAIRDLLSEAGARPADVGVLCFSQGPGSFTGLRVAATIARMWQSATGCRVVAVPTLEVIARNGLACEPAVPRLAVLVDARRGQVFGAVFARRDDELQPVSDPAVHDPAVWLPTLERPCAALGEGVRNHQAELLAAGLQALPESYWQPDARQVLVIGRRLAAAGRFCAPEQIVPLYLRPPACEEVYEARRAAARARRGM